jgi:hypothetical protein
MMPLTETSAGSHANQLRPRSAATAVTDPHARQPNVKRVGG